MRLSDTAPSSGGRRVLWVDDDVQSTDGSVRLLAMEGFRVDCVPSAEEGLRLARTAVYDAIILDLRLPDGDGLTVLTTLRGAGVLTPVLVLTGFGDISAAVTAMRVGADDFRQKPQFGDELVSAVQSVIEGRRPPYWRLAGPAPSDGGASGEKHLGQLFDALDRLSVAMHEEAPHSTSGKLAALLANAIIDPVLTVPLFLACAEALRRTRAGASKSDAKAVAWAVHGALWQARTTARTYRSGPVRRAVDLIAAHVREHRRPSEADVADELGIDRAHLGRLLVSRTGIGFREWRTGLEMQVAVRALAETDLSIKEIAHLVGFDHPSQFDREFSRLLGHSPRDFRNMCVNPP